MKAPLSLAAAIAASGLFGAALALADGPPPPRTFADLTCDPKTGTGALVRFRPEEDRELFETAAEDAFGLESADQDSGEQSGGADDKKGKKKPKTKKAKPKKKPGAKPDTFRMKPGKDCRKNLERLGGALGDRLDIVPDAPGLTPDKIDAAFKAPGVWSKLSGMKFESPAALGKLFDNALNGDKTAIGALLGGAGTPGGADGTLVKVDGSVVKVSPAGAPAEDFKTPKPPLNVPTPPPPGTINPDSFEHEPPPQHSWPVQKVVDGVDYAAQRAGDYLHGGYSDAKPFTLSPAEASSPVADVAVRTDGWSMLPASGPGYKFVGHGQWGVARVVKTLMEASADKLVNESGWLGAGPMPVVAISLEHGGHFPPHITHRVGIDVDVALWGYHGGPLNAKAADRNLMFAVSVVEHMKPNFILLDTQRQVELLTRARYLMSDPATPPEVKQRLGAAMPLLFDPGPAVRGKRLFSHVENHKDHFHVESKTGVLGR